MYFSNEDEGNDNKEFTLECWIFDGDVTSLQVVDQLHANLNEFDMIKKCN
jgi:hypothetical protein